MPEKFYVKTEVYPKDGMPDPSSSDMLRKIAALFPKAGVSNLRVAKLIDFVVEGENENEARTLTEHLASDLLVNPVIEDYEIVAIFPPDVPSS